jgi:hypothetical protein
MLHPSPQCVSSGIYTTQQHSVCLPSACLNAFIPLTQIEFHVPDKESRSHLTGSSTHDPISNGDLTS